ncbi:Rap1a/Tai family immunity protein [Massilia oculi]|uniref:Rap1a/Tai family immunity protein n=1 Tax=Massilia oculi TaxID=945844 RepID=UPI0028AD45F8|nr:Rap1a/Tai family immunity protein [Massilia oculi]
MKAGAWIALAACMPAGVLAAIPYVYPFNAMTGQEVVKHRLKEPKTQLDYINREKVEAYLNGIKDGAHGREWCLARPVLPDEPNLAVVRRLKATRKPAELKENAAPLVLAELRRRFPCLTPGKKKR